MADVKRTGLLILCWVIACLGFGALLADQQANHHCAIRGASFERYASQAHALVDWQQLLAGLTNEAFHIILHNWVC